MQLLHRALGGGRGVAVIPGIAHTNAVTALVPEGPEAQHTLLTAGTVSLPRPALAELLDEALAHITSTECFVTAQGHREPRQERQDGKGEQDHTGRLHDASRTSSNSPRSVPRARAAPQRL